MLLKLVLHRSFDSCICLTILKLFFHRNFQKMYERLTERCLTNVRWNFEVINKVKLHSLEVGLPLLTVSFPDHCVSLIFEWPLYFVISKRT